MRSKSIAAALGMVAIASAGNSPIVDDPLEAAIRAAGIAPSLKLRGPRGTKPKPQRERRANAMKIRKAKRKARRK